MSWVAIIIGLDDRKVKMDRFYLKKIIIGIVREDQFMYILLEVVYKYNVNGYNVSFFNFTIPTPWKVSYII